MGHRHLNRDALSQSRSRNRAAVEAGRLTLLEGSVAALSACSPVDIVMANHVLYFWKDPVAALTDVRGNLQPGGLLALGYQLRPNMPSIAQKRFPAAGHRLYETQDEVTAVALDGGFSAVVHEVKGSAEAPEGRVMLATA